MNDPLRLLHPPSVHALIEGMVSAVVSQERPAKCTAEVTIWMADGSCYVGEFGVSLTKSDDYSIAGPLEISVQPEWPNA